MSGIDQPAVLDGPSPPHKAVVDRPFQCTQRGCNKSYTRAWLLRKHVKAEHEGIRFPCPDCGTVVKYENDLRQHQSRIHQGQRRYVCKANGPDKSDCACRQSFATSSELYRHQRSIHAKVRAKAKASQRLAQQPNQPSFSLLRLGTMKQGGQMNASSPEHRSSTTDPTASIEVHQNSDQLHHLTSASARLRKARKPRGAHDTTQNTHSKALIPRQKPRLHSILRFGPTSSIELTLYSIRTYVCGSFEAGTWLPAEEDIYCVSTEKLSNNNIEPMYDQLSRVKTSLQLGDFRVANYQLSRVCSFAKVQLEDEEVTLISRLVEVLLEYYPAVNKEDNIPLKTSLDLVLRHFANMAVIVHGSMHPLTTILTSLQKQMSEENPGPGLQVALKQLLSCYQRVFGPYDSHSVCFKLAIINSEATPLSETWELLAPCDRVCGFDSYQSYHCLANMIIREKMSLDSQLVSRILEIMATRIITVQDQELVEFYMIACNHLKLRWLYKQRDWCEAATIIEHELIPLEVRKFGESSSAVVAHLRDLEYCLQHMGKVARVEEIESWRKSIEVRLFVEEEEDRWASSRGR